MTYIYKTSFNASIGYMSAILYKLTIKFGMTDGINASVMQRCLNWLSYVGRMSDVCIYTVWLVSEASFFYYRYQNQCGISQICYEILVSN